MNALRKQAKDELAEGIIDLRYLKEISMNDKEIMKELIKIFINQASNSVSNLKLHLATNDYDNLRSDAHKFLSNAKTVGLHEMGNFLEKIEEYAYNKEELNQLPDLVNKVETQTSTAVEYFTKYLTSKSKKP